MFELLKIDENNYKEAFEKSISSINEWNDVLENFLRKLPND